jgi:hypothetical protein
MLQAGRQDAAQWVRPRRREAPRAEAKELRIA